MLETAALLTLLALSPPTVEPEADAPAEATYRHTDEEMVDTGESKRPRDKKRTKREERRVERKERRARRKRKREWSRTQGCTLEMVVC